MRQLRILAGTSTTDLVPITDLVNKSKRFKLSSDAFEGEVVAHIKGLTDVDGNIIDSEYFEREDRKGITWSIQVQGRFLVPISADDILFGNTFDRPLNLPFGTSLALKFMQFIDPTLEHDLTSSTPWALSPLVSTMPHLAHKRIQHDAQGVVLVPPFPTSESVTDSTKELHLAVVAEDGSSPSASTCSSSVYSGRSASASSSSSFSSLSVSSIASGETGTSSKLECTHRQKSDQILQLNGASQRRAFFSKKANRKAVVFGPEDLITTDFCYGFLNFTPTISLELPIGLSFDLMRYYDGQQVRFICCERKRKDEVNGLPWGRAFWCIAIDVVEDE